MALHQFRGRRRRDALLVVLMPRAREVTAPQQEGEHEERGGNAGGATREHGLSLTKLWEGSVAT